tara:strand:+ start:737 stop:1600 length:864 start_codon:yes stop_codon:yes gene_type:complete
MKIMITGANGTIGTDLVDQFSKNNEVFAFYRTYNLAVKKVKNKNIKWIRQDLKNEIKNNFKPDVIIHSVVTHPFAKKNSLKDYINSNIISLKNVVDFAIKKKVKYFIYLSSFQVYGKVNNSQLDENTVINKPTILGATKLLGEKIIQSQKFNYIIIRLPGVVSYLNKDPRRPWINKIINDLKSNKKIEVYNSNKPFNNFIDTGEIYRFIEHIIKHRLFNEKIVNLSANAPKKLGEIIKFLKKNLNSKSEIVFKKEKTISYYISNKKLKKIFAFNTLSANKLLINLIK